MKTLKFSLACFVCLLTACGGGSTGGGTSEEGGNNSSDWLIPESEVLDGGPGKDGIPSINNPVFISAESATFLDDSDLVVGISYQGVTRAYPHRILNWHEIVNDDFSGNPLSINYCPLTGSAMLFDFV